MNQDFEDKKLLGVGIYTPAEAGRLTGVASAKIHRWLRGHQRDEQSYERLWSPQITLNDGIFLGFRDLTEVRVAAAFIDAGLSAQKVRRAIEIARDKYDFERPLSTNAFRTDGKNVFLVLAGEADDKIVDIFKDQFAIKKIIEPSFKGIEFNKAGEPMRWKISKGVVLDPEQSFGQPVDDQTFVPTQILANAAKIEGSFKAAAAAYKVSLATVKNAVAFEEKLAT